MKRMFPSADDRCRSMYDPATHCEDVILKRTEEFLQRSFAALEEKLEGKLAKLDARLNAVSDICADIFILTDQLVKRFTVQIAERLEQACVALQNTCNVPCGHNEVANQAPDENTHQEESPMILVCKLPTVEAQVSTDQSYQIIELNLEEHYPNGSWLGDEKVVEARVRVPITPGELFYINNHCPTPEKMAVTLLDYLFPRDVLANSNLSGKGKCGKNQLDPLLIYGIRCHLLYKFNITENDWYKIKINMNSKCRTYYNKKAKGQNIGKNRADLKDVSKKLHVDNGKNQNDHMVLDNGLFKLDDNLKINEEDEEGNLMRELDLSFKHDLIPLNLSHNYEVPEMSELMENIAALPLPDDLSK